MSSSSTRRRFLKTSAGAALLGLGDFGFLSRLRPVSADEARLDAGIVRLQPEIEPLVRLIEETPRDQLLDTVAARIDGGLSYREVLAALLLAGVRNVEPRPSVGFKFHAVLVVNSAHLASLSGPDSDRWLPIFWALDHFKSSQSRDEREGNWTMSPVDESALPPRHKARQALVDALESWDVPAADTAVAAMVRGNGANELFELFARYGARDFRSIGHKAIFVANSWRTLNCIGWQHAEPVLRSLAYAILNHHGEPNPAESDLSPDRPWRRNLELVDKIRPEWRDGQLDASATSDLLSTLHSDSSNAACDQVVDLLNRGVAPQSVCDALLVGAGELLMRQPAIVGLHAVTTTNAMRYSFSAAADDRTRRLILLQNAAFLPMFREAMKGRGNVSDQRIEALEPATELAEGDAAIEQIFADVSGRRTDAAREVLAYLNDGGRAESLIDGARRLIFLKGHDSHDYKFSSAALEDYYHVSPGWRNRFLATSVFNLKGTGDRDNPLVQRTLAAFA